ncbi:hypothetical protein GUITHDRAFT_120149 [Guillardia theta CCMP2712]|uniref:Uncharacterized protein n=1 Tax=Guillardia theta (strain CCMP2712) TaxID=905079 RepID=L1ICH3_GUITC|nr:hypothetical protein GUITHDRAFT_120149 [Guillardia theta CCMP2712]EKX33629.1 hypothetical protein GUITHDRAFT_120149 [Guillardia theta CCMP2712]|eukprot:XP_005820609.1 hypothetical protein GUITHDRAFT_120149 [Guillardia theta CCMP2712]
MLKRLRLQCIEYIMANTGWKKHNIMAYIHYLPSVFQLHIHFCAPYGSYTTLDVIKVHPLDTVISNLQNDSEYYRKATLTTVVVGNGTLLGVYGLSAIRNDFRNVEGPEIEPIQWRDFFVNLRFQQFVDSVNNQASKRFTLPIDQYVILCTVLDVADIDDVPDSFWLTLRGKLQAFHLDYRIEHIKMYEEEMLYWTKKAQDPWYVRYFNAEKEAEEMKTELIDAWKTFQSHLRFLLQKSQESHAANIARQKRQAKHTIHKHIKKQKTGN